LWPNQVLEEFVFERISSLCVQTKNQFSSLEFDTSLATFINGFLSDGEAIEE
jgi:hypothetical protein